MIVVYTSVSVSGSLPWPLNRLYSVLLLNGDPFPLILPSGGGPIHARVPIHAHPQFSQRFILFHGKDVYPIIDNDQFDHIHM